MNGGETERCYAVKIGEQECGFIFEVKEDGTTQLRIPDMGGQMDMIPRCPGQLEWFEPQVERIQEGLKRIWPTIWILETPEAVKQVEAILQREGKRVKDSFVFY